MRTNLFLCVRGNQIIVVSLYLLFSYRYFFDPSLAIIYFAIHGTAFDFASREKKRSAFLLVMNARIPLSDSTLLSHLTHSHTYSIPAQGLRSQKASIVYIHIFCS